MSAHVTPRNLNGPTSPVRVQGLSEGDVVVFEVELVDFVSERHWGDQSVDHRIGVARKWKEQGNTLFKQVRTLSWAWRIMRRGMCVDFELRSEWSVMCACNVSLLQAKLKLAKVKYLKAIKAVDRSLHCETEEQENAALETKVCGAIQGCVCVVAARELWPFCAS